MTTPPPQPATPRDEQRTVPTTKRRHQRVALGALALVLFAIAMAVFQPWLLFVNHEVNDEIPTLATPQSAPATGAHTPHNAAHADRPHSEQPQSAAAATQPATPAAPSNTPAQPAGPALVAQGSLISHEHETSGQVSIFRLPDGSHQLALEGLETTTGPDVHVWLSQAPVIEGFDGWFTAANYDHLDLGELKGNRGNQVYAIPADATIEDWTSITLWCEAFSVSFGAAELTPIHP